MSDFFVLFRRAGISLFLLGIPCAFAQNAAYSEEPPYKRLLKGDDAKQAADLVKKIGQFEEADQYADAIQAVEELLTLRRRAQGADHWQAVDASYELVGYKAVAGQSKERRAECRAVRQQVHEADEARAKGELARAVELNRKILELRRHVLGEDHPSTAKSWNSVAYDLNAQGKFEEAEPCYRKALEIWRKKLGEAHPETAVGFNNVAFNLQKRGKHAEAEPLFRQALQIRRRVLGEEDSATAAGYNNLATLLSAQARHAEAEPLYKHALDLCRRLLGEEQRDTARGYNNVGFCLECQGKVAEAEPFYRRAHEICRQVLGADHPLTALTADNIGNTLHGLERTAEAEPWLRQALDVRQRKLGNDHPETARSRNNLAMCLRDLDKSAEAESLLRQAVAAWRDRLGEEHPETARGRRNLASCVEALGRHAEAESLLRRSLRSMRQVLGEDHEDTIACFLRLAMNLAAQGQWGESLECLHSAAQGYEIARLRVGARGFDRSAYASGSPYHLLASTLAGAGQPVQAWEALEHDLARGLLDEYRTRSGAALAEADQRRLRELSGRLDALDQRTAALLSERRPLEQKQNELRDLAGERHKIDADLAKLAVEQSRKEVLGLEKVQAVLPADAALVAWVDVGYRPTSLGQRPEPAAPDRQTIAGEHWGCILKNTGPPLWVRLPGSGKDGAWTKADNLLIHQTQSALSRGDSAAGDVESIRRRLAAQRLGPLRPHLAGTRRLFVVPVGALVGLPVEALLEADASFTVSYVLSGTQLAKPSTPRTKPSERALLAVADPAFGHSNYVPLPGTRREVGALAPLFARATLLLDSDASAARLRELAISQELSRFRYLHFATHGEVDQRRSLQTALVFAQDRLPDPRQEVLAGRKPPTGRVTAQEMLDHWKLDADLVVLSACQSALGRESGGEGYVGFSQALVLAGARSVVVSLWQVDDTATALLMTRFYQNMLGKREGIEKPLPKAEALREAKQWLRNLSAKDIESEVARLPQVRGTERAKPTAPVKSAKPFEHPYYWSAFILIGDPN